MFYCKIVKKTCLLKTFCTGFYKKGPDCVKCEDETYLAHSNAMGYCLPCGDCDTLGRLKIYCNTQSMPENFDILYNYINSIYFKIFK